MENIRKKVDVRLVTNERAAKILASKANFDGSVSIFNENLIAIHIKET